MRFRLGTVGMVTAAMVSVLACYTLSLRVSAERSRVEDLRGHIAGQMRDIRALEAELKTRSRLPQLQRWNDDVLALSAPTAKQYADTAIQLASFAPGAPPPTVVPAVIRAAPPPAPAADPLVHTANYMVPPSPAVTPAPAVDDGVDAQPARPAPAKPAPAASLDKLRTSGPNARSASPTAVRAESVERVATRLAAVKPKASDAKGLDNLFGAIDHAANAEHGKLIKVSLR